MNLICFDLEGPLSPQDNAYELMSLFPNGNKIFEIISRYDDLLTLEGKEGYEPGDTLALIVPFLIYYGIKEKDIEKLAEKATLTPGAAKLISRLKRLGWKLFCISTSYHQYARHITKRVSIPYSNVACTFFPLDRLIRTLCKVDFGLVSDVQENLLALQPVVDDKKIKEVLDKFYWADLPATRLGKLMAEVKPVGGQRKVKALEKFALAKKHPLSQWIVVGDSITDFKMLQTVDTAGGIAIAFNANEYALPYATVGLATINAEDLWIILEVWQQGGRQAVERVVKEREREGGRGDRENFHWLAEKKDIATPLEIHKKIRRLLRGEAGKLG